MDKQNLKRHIRQSLLAVMLFGVVGTAWAGDVNFTNNQVTVGTDNYAISRTGGAVDPISVESTSDLDSLPSLSFTLEENSGSVGTETVYTVRIGIIITDKPEGASRRIEAKLGEADVTIDSSGVQDIQLATSPEMNVLARDADGTTVDVTSQSDLGVIDYSQSPQITLIPGNITNISNNLIQDVLDSLALSGEFQYRIYMIQTAKDDAGEPDLEFGHFDSAETPTFNPFDTDADTSDNFELGGTPAKLVSDFNDSYFLLGDFTLTEGDSDDEDQTAGDAIEDANTELDAITIDEDSDTVDDSTVAALNDALDTTVSALDTTADSVASEDEGIDTALSALDTGINKALDKSSTAREKGGAVEPQKIRNVINRSADVLNAVADRKDELTAGDLATLGSLTQALLVNSENLIADDDEDSDIESFIASLSDYMKASGRAGVELDDDAIDALKTVGNRAVGARLKKVLEDLDTDDSSAVRQALEDDPQLLELALDATVIVGSSIELDSDAVQQALLDRGLSAGISAEVIAALSNVSNPDGVVAGSDGSATQAIVENFGGNGTDSAGLSDGSEQFAAALTSGDAEVTVDDATGLVTISVPNEEYHGAVTQIRVVPASVPEGLRFRRDGRAVIVNNGMAVEISPVAADMLRFTAAVEDMGFSTSLRENGIVEIDLGNDDRFSGVFAYNNLAGFDGDCGEVTINEPSGPLNAASYAFEVECANGITQDVVPAVDKTAFFDAVDGFDLDVSVDRNTGFVTVESVGTFKPDYFPLEPTSFDDTFFEENAANGVAFRPLDANGDGVTDYKVITESSVQLMYSVQD